MIRRSHDERGVSLILVLVVLVVFGLLVPVLGQFGSANGVSGYKLAGQRYDRYTAEAGVQEAIAWAQANRPAGRHGVPCKGLGTGDLAAGNEARSATVTCVGYQGGGIPQATATAPTYAVQGTGGAIDLGGGRYRTDGPWWSDGTIKAPGVDASRDYVGAGGSCNGIQAAPAECGTGRKQPVPALDVPLPGVAPAVETIDRPAGPECRAPANHVIAIEPGFHWERPYFDAIADGDQGCRGVVLWLKPGLHVFDFDLYGLSGDSASFRAAGPVVVVGGTPSGWDPGSNGNQFDAARAAVRARAACRPDAAGTTVVVAGDSYFEMNPDGGQPADLQICGAPVGGVPVAFAQATGGSTGTAPEVSASSAPTTYSADGHGDRFDWQPASPLNANLLLNRECSSGSGAGPCGTGQALQGTLTGDGAVGTLTTTMADPIPAGSRLTSLTLRVNHRELERVGGIRRINLYVTGLGDIGDAADRCDLLKPDHRMDPNSDWPRTNESEDVFTCDLSRDWLAYFPSSDPLRVVYQVQLGNGDSGNNRPASADLALDEVRLDVKYQRPTFRTWTAPHGSDQILHIDRGARATFDGAVFTPTGDVSFDWARSTENGFRGGAIVRSFSGINLPGDPNYSPFELPGGGSYTDRVVTFAATVSGSDEDQPGPLVTARVLFCDPVAGGDLSTRNPKCTGAPNEQPSVIAWHTRQ